MAEFRTIRMAFWNDPYIEELEPKAKLLYIYLFTNPYTNNLGIIETTRRKIAFETGLNVADVDKMLAQFEKDGKVVCDSKKNLVFVTRFIKHQSSTSPKLMEGLQKLTVSITSEKIARALCILYPQVYGVSRDGGDTVTIPYADGIYTLTIPSGELGIWNLEFGNRNYSCAEMDEPSPTQDTLPAIFELPLTSNEKHPITQADVEHWHELYPAVDIMQALRSMLGWLEADPKRRKTKSGISRFINSWLSKEQNRGPSPRPMQQQSAPRLSWQEEKERRDLEAFLNDDGQRPWEVQHG